MKTTNAIALRAMSGLTLALLALALVGPNTPRAGAQPILQTQGENPVQRCDGNRLIHEATNEYRWFYDPRYAGEQRISAATNEYRWIYDPRYAAEQRMAGATDRYCDGTR